MTDYRDLVITELADHEAALVEHVLTLSIDRDSYRLLAQQAIHQLHELTRQLDRTREEQARLRAEYRALREQMMREAVAA